jgi:hypothetical protein
MKLSLIHQTAQMAGCHCSREIKYEPFHAQDIDAVDSSNVSGKQL